MIKIHFTVKILFQKSNIIESISYFYIKKQLRSNLSQSYFNKFSQLFYRLVFVLFYIPTKSFEDFELETNLKTQTHNLPSILHNIFFNIFQYLNFHEGDLKI